MSKLQQFKVVYLLNGKLKEYPTRAKDGFSAEVKFLKWAKDLLEPVRVVRVERIAL